MTERVAIVGTRDGVSRERSRRFALSSLRCRTGTIVISGGARGVDKVAIEAARTWPRDAGACARVRNRRHHDAAARQRSAAERRWPLVSGHRTWHRRRAERVRGSPRRKSPLKIRLVVRGGGLEPSALRQRNPKSGGHPRTPAKSRAFTEGDCPWGARSSLPCHRATYHTTLRPHVRDRRNPSRRRRADLSPCPGPVEPSTRSFAR